jgi:phage terminase large subunit-like protein
MEMFAAGAEHRERLMLAANRIGKTEGVGGYESTLHLTGLYPAWWVGKRFDHPVQWWAAGRTNETTRDIVQAKLFGKVEFAGGRKGVSGTGLVPAETIGDVHWKSGVPDLIDTVSVKHVSGGLSVLGLKSYQQGRGSFEGTEQDGIWLDEEPPLDVYSECLVRTMTTDGCLILTFTPLEGMSDVVMLFLQDGKLPTVQ